MKYSDFTDVFFSKLVLTLFQYTKMNNLAIKLINKQQLFYKPYYSLGLVELEILKTYIKINLANRFIRLFKCLI